MGDTILRQIEMLRLIPRTGKITPQQLKSRLASLGYDTTERTVQRDLNQLSTLFAIHCDDRSKPHGWQWSEGIPVCQLPGLSTAEALAFHMLAQFEADLLPADIRTQLKPYFDAAKSQLSLAVGPRAALNWLNKVRSVSPNQPLLAASVQAGTVEAVHAALMADQCLEITYRSDGKKPQAVHPLGLVQSGASTYLVANFDGFDDIRILALHRIRSATVLERKAVRPAGFNLDAYIAQGGFGFGEVGKLVAVELRFFNYAGQHLQETRLSDDQECHEEAPGQLLVRATVQSTRRLRWWLQGFGADVEVLKPTALRTQVAQSMSQAAERYRAS